MKQLVYHIIVCGMAVLFLTACEKDDDISGRSMEKFLKNDGQKR